MTSVLQNLIKILFLFLFATGFACDVCSCATNAASSMNIHSNSHYISFSYNYLNFKFKDGVHDNSPYGYDNIHQFKLNGQYVIHDDLAIQLSIPYQKNIRTSENGEGTNMGIGDISLNGVYTVYRHENHIVKTGLGVKLPTGDFNYAVATTTNTTANQLGTGSLDISIPLEYIFVDKKLTAQVKGVYYYKTENSDDFKFGNQTQLQLLASYKILEYTDHFYGVNIGMSYDSYLETEIRQSKILNTDGYLMNASLGIKYESNKIIGGINYQAPVSQNLIDGEVTFKQGLNLYAYYKF